MYRLSTYVDSCRFIAPAPKDLYRKMSMIPETNATCEVGASHSVLSPAPAPLSVPPADHPQRTEKFDSIDDLMSAYRRYSTLSGYGVYKTRGSNGVKALHREN
ncbi:hypothetical protein PsorP6_015211 [Peronosclerospora sorghi]|uniref:Uncharacterized protein n=1 Tax=Peronosclerospora sorghi TaxID=230839 RepID=A0ACC0VRT7_9STRA|nr:hypothetical protein PsorP6_015211 [Peronosclerospora sorghi]